MTLRLGVFGGTFDPVHIGHLLMADAVVEALALDRLLMVPAQRSPLKPNGPSAADADRVAMLEAATAGDARFAVDRVDLDRPPPSYTVDTLRLLAAAHPGAELILVVGLDSFLELGTWRDPSGIAALAHLAVVDRPGYAASSTERDVRLTAATAALPALLGRWTLVDAPLIDLSATDVRRRVAEGRSIRWRVPEAVAAHIAARGLYRQASAPGSAPGSVPGSVPGSAPEVGGAAGTGGGR